MLTLNDLSRTLVELTGCQPAEADDFLRELFALAAEKIEAEGAVEVPLLGRFAIADGTVQFRPDADLAAEVNSPFADFQPIEVPASFAIESEGLEQSEQSEESEQLEQLEQSEQLEEAEILAEPEPETEPEIEAETEAETEPEPEPEPEIEPEPEVVKTRRALGCCRGMLIGLIGVIVGFVGGWFAAQYYSPKKVFVVIDEELPEEPLILDTIPAEEPDTVEIEQPRPLVTDTVRVGRYLTTMAKDHYGQKEYWVYIYEANPQFGDPNALSAGTVVIIPPADSLGLVAGDEAKLAEAQRKLNEIWARFN